MTAGRPPRGSILVAGGGTAGHLVPGLAVARALVEQGWDADRIHFVGSARGVETDLVPAEGFGLTALPGRGLNERRVGLANLRNLVEIVRGILLGCLLVVRVRPAAVLSLGGYAALPASIGAVLTGTPLVITEQNAVPSSTNRLLSRFAKACAIPFPGLGLRNEVVIGNPVRRAVVEAAARRNTRPWPTGRFRVVAFGGSLGSLRINEAVWGGARRLAERGDVFVYHVVGHRDWRGRPELDLPADAYCAVEYDHDLPSALGSADLVVGRAGGSTVAELAVVGVASVLIPLPIAIHDHQRRNAAVLEDVGAARVVDDPDFDADRLVEEVERFVSEGVTDAAEAARTVGHPDAAERVASLIVDHARGRRP